MGPDTSDRRFREDDVVLVFDSANVTIPVAPIVRKSFRYTLLREGDVAIISLMRSRKP